jgi:hypothetical protein
MRTSILTEKSMVLAGGSENGYRNHESMGSPVGNVEEDC